MVGPPAAAVSMSGLPGGCSPAVPQVGTKFTILTPATAWALISRGFGSRLVHWHVAAHSGHDQHREATPFSFAMVVLTITRAASPAVLPAAVATLAASGRRAIGNLLITGALARAVVPRLELTPTESALSGRIREIRWATSEVDGQPAGPLDTIRTWQLFAFERRCQQIESLHRASSARLYPTGSIAPESRK
jgi:hypothetical protein